jgi:hypothetical protein
MDDKGNLYEFLQEVDKKVKVKNLDTGEEKIFPKHTLDKMAQLDEKLAEVAKKMSRNERRQLFKKLKENK